jgi:hypothetical protein
VTESGKILPRRVTGMPAICTAKSPAKSAQPLGAAHEMGAAVSASWQMGFKACRIANQASDKQFYPA